MKQYPYFYTSVKALFFVVCIFLMGTLNAQTTIEQCETEIENYEQKIKAIEKEITINSTSGNSSANSALQQQIQYYEQEIDTLISKIKRLQSGVKNDEELECMALKKELDATEAIVGKLENEMADLQKEIQRLTMQGGGSAEIEKLQRKLETVKAENEVLKQQITGYRQNSNSNSGSSAQIIKLEAKIKELHAKNNLLQQQLNKANSNSQSTDFHHFQKQFVLKNATSVVFGYRYTILPTLNFNTSRNLYEGTNKVGTLLSVPNQQIAGHNGFFGLEFLFHGMDAGANIGLTADYSYNSQKDITYQIVSFRFSPELTILPIRIGIKPSAHFGYVWGQFQNHDARLNSNTISANPAFSTLVWGWDAKLRVYISRFVAFTGSIGADYPLSKDFKMDFWDTSPKFGVGIDFIIPVRVR